MAVAELLVHHAALCTLKSRTPNPMHHPTHMAEAGDGLLPRVPRVISRSPAAVPDAAPASANTVSDSGPLVLRREGLRMRRKATSENIALDASRWSCSREGTAEGYKAMIAQQHNASWIMVREEGQSHSGLARGATMQDPGRIQWPTH